MLAWQDEIVHTHGIGAVGKKTLVGAPLVVGISDTNPEKDVACLDCILEVSGVPGDEPKAKSMLEAVVRLTGALPSGSRQGAQMCRRPTQSCPEMVVVERSRAPGPCHDGLSGEHALQSHTIEAVEDKTTSTKVAQCFAHLRPAVERADHKTQLGLLGQRNPRERSE